uniref:hypothetical protein n=1 Tax=Deinococcus sp. UR1 TaxID=1704277 RepID=UPI001F535E74
PLTADPLTLFMQVGFDAQRPVRSPALLEAGPDFLRQHAIFRDPLALRPSPRSVVPADAHLENPAHQFHWELVLVPLDEMEDQGCFAKKASAFLGYPVPVEQFPVPVPTP